MKKILNASILLVVSCLIIFFIFDQQAKAEVSQRDVLIKGSTASVYYLASDNKRYVFPNQKTYNSWFSDFSNIIQISDQDLALFPLGGNVRYRPGIRLVKIQTDPKVYAVDAGGKLRWIKTESIASQLYGSDWGSKVDDIPVAFFINYTVGNPVESASDYSPQEKVASTQTINSNRDIAVGTNPRKTDTGLLIIEDDEENNGDTLPTQPPACTENWSCGDWSTCSSSSQSRTCTDLSNCGTTNSKPAVSQTCSVCIANDNYCPWECNDWKLDLDCGVPAIYDFVESRSPSQYLASNYIHWDDTDWRTNQSLINQVNQIISGINNDYDKATAIAGWVQGSRNYSLPSPANEIQSVIDIFEANSGVCMDAAILTTAMLRIAGIPARAILPSNTSHQHAEAYIDGKWIGFDSTFTCNVNDSNCISGDARVINPVTSISYVSEFYKHESKYMLTNSLGNPEELSDITYYKVNIIPRTIYKDAQANIRISWDINSSEPVSENVCILTSFSTGATAQSNSSPLITTIDNSLHTLQCSTVFSGSTSQYNDNIYITFTGQEVTTQDVLSSGFLTINVDIIDDVSTPAGWGTIYIPTTARHLFKNKNGTHSLSYDPEQYENNTAISWRIKSDNLNCDWYNCQYTESNGFATSIQRVGILGYGNYPGVTLKNTLSNIINGFAKITLPEGKYKLIYSIFFGGDVGSYIFDVSSNSTLIIRPNQIGWGDDANQNKFDILIESLSNAIEGLNP